MQFDSDLLAQLYATAEDDARWMPVLDQLCRNLNASSAVVQLLEEGAIRTQTLWTARDTRSSKNSSEHDRWINNAENPRLGEPLSAIPPRLSSVLSVGSDSRLYTDYPGTLAQIRERITKAGLGQAFWASFALSPRKRFSLVLHRQAGDYSDLSETEEAALSQLLPHLEQSVRLASSLRTKQSRVDVLEKTLEHIEIGMLLCNSDLEVLWSNPVAAKLIRQSPALTCSGNVLKAHDTSDNARLAALVSAASGGDHAGLVDTIDPFGECPVHVRAVGSYDKHGHRIVSLYLSGPAHPVAPDPLEIAQLYNLTPAEARLTAAIGAGRTLAEYAEATGVTVGTARNQLKQVLSKTYTGRQADLVRVLSGSVLAQTRSRPN